MSYKITALKDVTIRARIHWVEGVRAGNAVGLKSIERDDWIPLKAGEVREDISVVLGVHPKCLFDELPVFAFGVDLVLAESTTEDPHVFFGLFRAERI